MTLDEQRLRHLLRLFAENKASEAEIREMRIRLRIEDDESELESVKWERIWDTVYQSVRPVTPVRKIKWLRVAAAILVFISMGVYLFNRSSLSNSTKNDMVNTAPQRELSTDVQPGGNKAILTLANGSQIVLDSAANGLLAHQGNAEVIKLANGQLEYKGAGSHTGAVMYNTMGTPRGGQYRLILPDGSKVWLNAVSSIRYPTAFISKERKVEISGEVYFEIARDLSRPFKVVVNPSSANERMEVSVLGTHFNINAYNDEPNIKTTLLEGSVKVTIDSHSTIIKPGEQTEVNKDRVVKIVRHANVEEAVAWKDGLFEFKDADLEAILRQVMRWYDVDVEYQGGIPDRYFTAIISRDKTLTGFLEILKMSDIDYRLERNKLIITP